ncbi:unnamed protein product, partial [Prorocentrum cordatum]
MIRCAMWLFFMETSILLLVLLFYFANLIADLLKVEVNAPELLPGPRRSRSNFTDGQSVKWLLTFVIDNFIRRL